tara:strand:- start:8814 stop:8921 length:108 start_codon:yes stop_codon:yes gene_type:complete
MERRELQVKKLCIASSTPRNIFGGVLGNSALKVNK